MKLIVVLVMLFSAHSYAQESQKCADTYNAGRATLVSGEEKVNEANRFFKEAQEADDLESACHKAIKAFLALDKAVELYNNGRITTQEAILYCKQAATQQKIIQNLNFAFENYVQTVESRRELAECLVTLGCVSDEE